MILTMALAFFAGVITILSPCVLPLLPLILGAATQADRLRPWGIMLGFVLAFTAATLALSLLVKALGVPPDFNRVLSACVLAVLGLVLVVPRFGLTFERWTAAMPMLAPKGAAPGALGGITVGLGLGLAWSPCVGPIMAAVITLALNQAVGPGAIAITLAFALGTCLPMGAVLFGGRSLVRRLAWTQTHARAVQGGFGLVLILTGMSIWLGWDRQAQIALLDHFPAWQTALIQWQAI
jgi:cytochrome c biogenesis protein CcdA